MENQALQETLEQLVTPLLEAHHVDLVELMVSGGHRRKMVRLYVDSADGVTVDVCAQLSREIGDLFDTHDPIDGTYVLEVSSPGLTRPLKTDRDFLRVVGKMVSVDVLGKGPMVGLLKGVETGHLMLEMDGDLVAIDRQLLQKANLHFEI